MFSIKTIELSSKDLPHYLPPKDIHSLQDVTLLHRFADRIEVFQWAFIRIEFWHVVLTIPMKAPFNVLVKLHLGAPFRPNLLTSMTVMLPPDPPITVLLITRAITSLSPGFVMFPTVPPLNARNPAIRIMPPRPVSFREINYVNNERRRKRVRKS